MTGHEFLVSRRTFAREEAVDDQDHEALATEMLRKLGYDGAVDGAG